MNIELVSYGKLASKFDMDEYQHFVAKKLASIENLGQVQSAFVMTEVKSELNLPVH